MCRGSQATIVSIYFLLAECEDLPNCRTTVTRWISDSGTSSCLSAIPTFATLLCATWVAQRTIFLDFPIRPTKLIGKFVLAFRIIHLLLSVPILPAPWIHRSDPALRDTMFRNSPLRAVFHSRQPANLVQCHALPYGQFLVEYHAFFSSLIAFRSVTTSMPRLYHAHRFAQASKLSVMRACPAVRSGACCSTPACTPGSETPAAKVRPGPARRAAEIRPVGRPDEDRAAGPPAVMSGRGIESWIRRDSSARLTWWRAGAGRRDLQRLGAVDLAIRTADGAQVRRAAGRAAPAVL
jgi:hypothetical protein